MDFAPPARATDLIDRVRAFIETEIDPVEADYHRDLAARQSDGDPWRPLPVIEELRAKARSQGLWNLFLPVEHAGPYAERFGTLGGEGLSNADCAPIAELTGRSHLAPAVFNCDAPDTGNMEVLLRYGSEQQKEQWLEPLLDTRIRSAFCMTEPDVASSDATNMELRAEVVGDEVVVNGHKWWSTGVGHPGCELLIVMGLTDPEADRHQRHSMVLVPRSTPGVRVERMLVLNTVWKLDQGGPLNALSEVSRFKVAVPNMAQWILDFAIQMHGGAGLSSDFPLAGAWTTARALRLADGPDEVHRGVMAHLELMKHGARR